METSHFIRHTARSEGKHPYKPTSATVRPVNFIVLSDDNTPGPATLDQRHSVELGDASFQYRPTLGFSTRGGSGTLLSSRNDPVSDNPAFHETPEAGPSTREDLGCRNSSRHEGSGRHGTSEAFFQWQAAHPGGTESMPKPRGHAMGRRGGSSKSAKRVHDLDDSAR